MAKTFECSIIILVTITPTHVQYHHMIHEEKYSKSAKIPSKKVSLNRRKVIKQMEKEKTCKNNLRTSLRRLTNKTDTDCL